jgi:DNA-binding transcriptional ArsR family regulator
VGWQKCMKSTLKERLERYLRNNHGWIASGTIQRIASEKTSYTPSNVSRRLRELENEGVLEVQYRKGHAYYRCKVSDSPEIFAGKSLAYFEGLPG